MTEEDLRQLFKQTGHAKKRASVGLRNIDRRLKQLIAKDYILIANLNKARSSDSESQNKE